MTIIVVLVIVSLMPAGGFLIAFLWAVKTGQFDDTYTPSVRILLDKKNEKDLKKNHTS